MTDAALLPTLLPMVEKSAPESFPVRYPEFAQRLQKAMQDAGLSITDVKTRLKVSYEMARRYALGQAMPRQEKLAALAQIVGSTPSFLAFGTEPETQEADMPLKSRPVVAVSDEQAHPGAVRVRRVKLRLSAGIVGFAIEPVEEDGNPIYLPDDWVEKRGYRRENLIAIEIKGHSMESSLFEGDTVIINTADTTPIDGEVYAVNYEGEPVVKRLIKDAGAWWLASDNPDQRRYPRKQCSGDMCLLVGRVVKKESERI